MSDEFAYDVTDGIATLRLCRPDKGNVLSRSGLIGLAAAVDAADRDDAVRAIIFTGEGTSFCNGIDISAGNTFQTDPAPGEIRRGPGGLLSLRIFECTKPVIGAVNGTAVGIGATMLLPMDIRVAANTARFGFVFTRRGIVPEACSTWFLPRAVGISRSLKWTYGGSLVPAAEALEAGLVLVLTEKDALYDRAVELARDIAVSTSAVSVALTRQMMWRMLGADHPM